MYRKPSDLAQARYLIERLLNERDALVGQIEAARQQLQSMQRQLQARESESAYLVQTLRAREAAGPPASDARLARLEAERDAAVAESIRLRERLRVVEQVAERFEIERDEAAAERDSAIASNQHAQAAHAELRESSPDQARLQHLAADLANVRRLRDEQIEAGIAREKVRLLGEVAGVLDSVSIAIDRSPDPSSPWHAGLLAIQAQFDGLLRREGARVVGRAGERFDPRIHEAVATRAADGDAGIVLDVVGSGILLGDDVVVRPARVVVSE